MADNEVSKITWIAIVVALAGSVYSVSKTQIPTLTNTVFDKIGKIVGIDNVDRPESPNPDDAKWVTKGDYGTNGKFVVDKDGNAVIYAIDASKPIMFHDMWNENAKLPKAELTSLTFQDKVQGDTNSSMSSAFTDTFTNLKAINNLDTNVDTSNVTDMNSMFQDSQLTSVGDLGQWDTSNVTNMNGTFLKSQLISVGDLSQWNTSKVTNMYAMFRDSKLTPPAWYH